MMKTRQWPLIAGVSVCPDLSDGGDLIVMANVEPSPNFPSGRVGLFETSETCPTDDDNEPSPRVSCGLTSRQARLLSAQLLEAADAADEACPEHAQVGGASGGKNGG